MNYCLNYIHNNPDLEYDLVIGNMSTNRDWYFAYNKVDDTDYENLGNFDKWFDATQEQERVRVFDVTPVIVWLLMDTLWYTRIRCKRLI